MNTFSNNSRITMDTSSETLLKKDLISIKPKMKRKNLKNKRPHLKDFANSAKKFSQKKSKKFKSQPDSTNHHAPWSPVNTDGQPTWKES